MIPKIIHYCWFGGSQLPELAARCIESWKKYCPDYEIIEWNENNYNIDTACQFVKEAYKKQKWAFVSDYIRLDVIYRYGGVYLDTDVELLRSPEPLLKDGRGFFGFEDDNSISSGLGFACEKEEPVLREMMDYYKGIVFSVEHMGEIKCPIINTMILEKHGLIPNNKVQVVNGIKILPTEYLSPENMYTGKSNYTKNTVSVHHYNGSWLQKKEKQKLKAILFVKKRLPRQLVLHIRRIARGIRRLYDKKRNAKYK